jgi:hypothetical protein
MMRLGNIFLVATVFTAMSCTTSGVEQECESDECFKTQAYDNVIAVHDKVMAKMSSISELKGQIEERMNAEEDSVEIAGWQHLMENLDSADNEMWVWMRRFNPELEEVGIEKALDYLKEEQEKIDDVAKNINEAIANAKKSLSQ